jgi:hypothetical protein
LRFLINIGEFFKNYSSSNITLEPSTSYTVEIDFVQVTGDRDGQISVSLGGSSNRTLNLSNAIFNSPSTITFLPITTPASPTSQIFISVNTLNEFGSVDFIISEIRVFAS